MKLKEQALFWVTAVVMLLIFVWMFKIILLPFVVGTAIAYLLNPLLVKLGELNISRTVSTILILFTFTVLVISLCLLLLPPLYREVVQLADRAPEYADSIWSRLQPYVAVVEETMIEDDFDESVQDAIRSNVSNALSVSSSVLGRLLDGGRALISITTFAIVTPLVAFFMMIEWHRITDWVDELLPRHSYDQVKSLLARIDKKISGFIRGQLLVALLLAVLYAVALTIAGLQYGFIIGLAAGMLSIIPLLGSSAGLFVGMGVAWLQTSELSFVAVVAAVFMLGQFLEGNFITPKIMGDSVGLHPLWILFSLMAGGALFGIVGMVIAVPVAAAAGVLLSFAIEQYKQSHYYEL